MGKSCRAGAGIAFVPESGWEGLEVCYVRGCMWADVDRNKGNASTKEPAVPHQYTPTLGPHMVAAVLPNFYHYSVGVPEHRARVLNNNMFEPTLSSGNSLVCML